jgi:hypothetical protein
MDHAVRGFFFERFLLTLVTCVLYAAGLALSGVPYWFLLGLVIGLASLVHFLSAIGWALALLLGYDDVLVAERLKPDLILLNIAMPRTDPADHPFGNQRLP